MNDLLLHTDAEIVRVLETLSIDDWSRPSLCRKWSVRSVVSHLASVNIAPLAHVGRRVIAQRGNINRANLEIVRSLDSRWTNSELIAVIRSHAGKRRRVGRLLPPALMLGDHLIHLLDIAVPLEREPSLRADALRAVLRTQLRLPNPFVPAARFGRDICFDATDIDWRSRDAPLGVRGDARDIVLTLAGRTTMIHRLDGNGVRTLANRISRWTGSAPVSTSDCRSRRVTPRS